MQKSNNIMGDAFCSFKRRQL